MLLLLLPFSESFDDLFAFSVSLDLFGRLCSMGRPSRNSAGVYDLLSIGVALKHRLFLMAITCDSMKCLLWRKYDGLKIIFFAKYLKAHERNVI